MGDIRDTKPVASIHFYDDGKMQGIGLHVEGKEIKTMEDMDKLDGAQFMAAISFLQVKDTIEHFLKVRPKLEEAEVSPETTKLIDDIMKGPGSKPTVH